MTTSPISWAACARLAISSFAVRASVTAFCTSSVAVRSCRLISAIELLNSSAAFAAAATLTEAWFDVFTAPEARCEVSLDEIESAATVDFIVLALSPTVFRTASMLSRNPTIASSMVARRFSCSAIAARRCSTSCCSVTSSWVATHPPPAIGCVCCEWCGRRSV